MQQNCQFRFLIFRVLSQRFFDLKLSIFKIFQFFCIFEKWQTFSKKISVTKFQKSKFWIDSFVAFSVGYVVVYSIFSVGAVFKEKFASQNCLNYDFSKMLKFSKMLWYFSIFWDTLCIILLDIICPVSICDQMQKTPCNFDKKWLREKTESANVLVTFV